MLSALFGLGPEEIEPGPFVLSFVTSFVAFVTFTLIAIGHAVYAERNLFVGH